jgi:hypothetical protein
MQASNIADGFVDLVDLNPADTIVLKGSRLDVAVESAEMSWS